MRKNKAKDYKIFMGMSEIAGYFTRLSDSFEELGIENYFVDYGINKFNYNKKYKPFENFAVKKLKKAHTGFYKEKNFLKRAWSKCGFVFYMVVLFIWALFHANVFIFIYGNTFFSHMPLLEGLDLKLLRQMRKTMIFAYMGSDSRPLYISSAINASSIDDIIFKTKKQSEVIKKIERYATYVIDNPASSHFHCKKFINFFEIGMPIDDFVAKAAPARDQAKPVTILHAPTNPELKGTDKIRDTIENLKRKGHHINYIELIGVPNSTVRENIDQCDFIIDELYSDCPLAGFSTEAAIAGKPAIIGGYAGDFLKRIYAEDQVPPSIYTDPDDLESTVEQTIINKQFADETGRKARVYVNENWAGKAVAEKYLKIINGEAPESWYYNPYECDYLFGCGVDKNKIIKAVTEIIKEHGISALCIDDKPLLLKGYRGLLDGAES